MGWRYLLIILGAITLVVFFLRVLVFRFYESPKFLLSKGKEAEAIEVLHKIAKFNKAPPPVLTVDMFRAIDETSPISSSEPTGPLNTTQTTKKVLGNIAYSLRNLKALFTNRLQAFVFFLLAVAYMGDYWSFNLAGSYLPIILLRNEVDSGQGTVTETYRHYVYIYLPGILGAVLALISVQLPIVGRKWSLVFSAICQGLSMAMYTQVKTTAGYVGLNALEYIMQTVSPHQSNSPCDLADSVPVLQRGALRISSGTLRYQLPRLSQWHAVVSWSHSWYCSSFRWTALSCDGQFWHFVAWGRRYLVVGVHDGVFAG